MWTAGSGKIGTKLRGLGVDEIAFTGRAERPTLLRITPSAEGADAPAEFRLEDASHQVRRRTNDKIQTLHATHPEAHFAVIGPAGESYRANRMAAVALSTENQLVTGEPKPRFCGRGGIGGVMGSKSLLAIVADGPDPPKARLAPAVKALNKEAATGKGSARFREKETGGGGGTWANAAALEPVGGFPEFNFSATGDGRAKALLRDTVEAGPWTVKAESCHRCGIRCHKNVYEPDADGRPARFRAKLDYEPLDLLSANLGIYDVDQCCTLIQLVDELGMDCISCGGVLGFAMEHNRRRIDAPVAGGLTYGDFEGARDAIVAMGEGRLPELAQGTLRLADEVGGHEYAMHCKGVEFPAYLPHTNPGYPFALAGGHMSMRTYLLALYERETSVDYWVDAITSRGPQILRDDLLGICKFAAVSDEHACDAVRAVSGLEITPDELRAAVMRAHLRGYRIERRQGFTEDDYDMPAEAHRGLVALQLPQFNTEAFFAALKPRVLARFDELAASL
jgi:aldehyde:ferredoxin oxidoreductase